MIDKPLRNPKIAILGGLNRDIGAKAAGEIIAQDSNIGKIWENIGGVGYNIAANLSNLGISSNLITALGDDVFSREIQAKLPQANINLQHSLKVTGANCATYLYVLDEFGEMQLAVNDMEIVKLITPEFVAGKLEFINSMDLLVIDANLPQETIEFVANNVKVPIFAEPVSTTKAMKLKNVLDKFYAITPNLLEAAYLCGDESQTDYREIALQIVSKGVRSIFITMGANGAYAANSSGKSTKSTPYGLKPVNVTGAGDSFMAAIVFAYINALDIEKSAKFATLLAEIKTQSADTISDEISIELARQILGDL